MKLDKKAMRLYIVTDRSWLGNNSFLEQIENTLKAGATFLQLREKEISYSEFKEEALEVQKLAKKYKVPFVINDNVELAMEIGADGVHVGQSDMKASNVRKMIGDDKILGVSVQTLSQAKEAEFCGADYLGVGAVFSTSTKLDADSVSFETLQEICNSVTIPIVAIGGINENNIFALENSGIDGVVAISAIFAKDNIYEAAKKIEKLSNEVVKH